MTPTNEIKYEDESRNAVDVQQNYSNNHHNSQSQSMSESGKPVKGFGAENSSDVVEYGYELVGIDFEYYEDDYGRKPVAVSLAVPRQLCKLPESLTTHPDIVKTYSEKVKGKWYCGLCFDAQNFDNPLALHTYINSWAESLVGSYTDFQKFKTFDLKFVAHNNIAEFGILVPTKEYLKELINVQGDITVDEKRDTVKALRVKYNEGNPEQRACEHQQYLQEKDEVEEIYSHNLSPSQIQGSVYIKNLTLGLEAENLSITWLDTMWLCGSGKKSLQNCAESLGTSKFDGGFDFEKHNAVYYYNNETDKFTQYNIQDSIISIAYYSNIQSKAKDLINDLRSERLIELSEKSLNNLESGRKHFITLGSITSYLEFAHLECLGVKDKFIESSKWCFEKMPLNMQVVRGGANKNMVGDFNDKGVWVSDSKLIKGVTSVDVQSMYTTIHRFADLPLWEPTLGIPFSATTKSRKSLYAELSERSKFDPSYGKILENLHEHEYIPLGELAKALDLLLYPALLDVDVKLPEKTPPYKRCLDFKDNHGNVIYFEEGESNFFATQLLLQAEMTPDAVVLVKGGLSWSIPQNPNDLKLLEVDKLYKYFTETRDKLKKEAKVAKEAGDLVTANEKDLEQNLIKNISNCGYGKKAQMKEGYMPVTLHDVIAKDGSVSSTAVKQKFTSPITHPLFARLITCYGRVYNQLIAYQLQEFQNCKIVQQLTDSTMFQGKWSDYEVIKNLDTRYEELNDLKKHFSMELDEVKSTGTPIEGKDLYFLKKRGYVFLEYDDEIVSKAIRSRCDKGKPIPESYRDKVKILKLGKGGYKTSKSETGFDLLNKFIECNNGVPMKSKAPNFVKSGDYFLGNTPKGLGDSYVKGGRGIGADDICFCPNIDEFKNQQHLKEKAKKLGFTDARALRRYDPDIAEKLEREVKRNKKHHSRQHPAEIRCDISIAALLGESVRMLEDMTGISKSTIHRWKKQLRDSNYRDYEKPGEYLAGFNWDKLNDFEKENKKLELIQRIKSYCEIQGIGSFHNPYWKFRKAYLNNPEGFECGSLA